MCFGQPTPDFKSVPQLAWKFVTKGPIFSSPVIDNKTVYFGSIDSVFYAIDIVTGKAKWKLKTRGDIRSTPFIFNEKVYFISGDGKLYCVNNNNGKVSWEFKTEGEKKYELYSYADYYQSSPIIDSGIVYFGSGDSHVYAVDAANGKLIWKYKTNAVVHSSPALQNEKLFIGSFDGNLYALNKNDGKLLWKFKTVGHRYFPKGEVQGTAGVFGSLVFVGPRDYNLYAIDVNKGYAHWNRQFPLGWAMGKPSFKDSTLFVGTSDDKLLIAFDPPTGTIKWRSNVQFNIFGGSAFSESMLYVGTLMGKLLGINRKTGEIKWSFTTDNYKTNRTIYFKEDDTYRDDVFGGVIKRNEDFLKMYFDVGSIFSTPAIDGDYLVFSSTDGNVYCLKNN